MIDTGSSINLIKDSVVPSELCVPIGDNAERFFGINGSPLSVINIFYSCVTVKDVRIKIKFYTVSDETMSFSVLGRDFIACPSIRVTLGESVDIAAREDDVISEMMSIESGSDFCNLRDKLAINAAVGEETTKSICEAYESCYLAGLRERSHLPDFEMVIALRRDQPISSRPRRLSFADKEILRKILDAWVMWTRLVVATVY